MRARRRQFLMSCEDYSPIYGTIGRGDPGRVSVYLKLGVLTKEPGLCHGSSGNRWHWKARLSRSDQSNKQAPMMGANGTGRRLGTVRQSEGLYRVKQSGMGGGRVADNNSSSDTLATTISKHSPF